MKDIDKKNRRTFLNPFNNSLFFFGLLSLLSTSFISVLYTLQIKSHNHHLPHHLAFQRYKKDNIKYRNVIWGETKLNPFSATNWKQI